VWELGQARKASDIALYGRHLEADGRKRMKEDHVLFRLDQLDTGASHARL
jgi:hypothetical protein